MPPKVNKNDPGLASQARSIQQLQAAHTKVFFCCLPDVRDLEKQFCTAFVIRYDTLNLFFPPQLQLRENSANQSFTRAPSHPCTLSLNVSPVGTDVAVASWPQGNSEGPFMGRSYQENVKIGRREGAWQRCYLHDPAPAHVGTSSESQSRERMPVL